MLSSVGLGRCFVSGLLILFAGEAISESNGSGGGAGIRKGRNGTAPSLGRYRLDMKTTGILGLQEFSAADKLLLNPEIVFRNERIYNAPSAQFAGRRWEIVLGAVDGRVYKISALIAFDKRNDRDVTWRDVNTLLKASLGKPARTDNAIVAWNTEDGNVVINRADTGEYLTVVTLTSRAISTFERVH